jgi:hypothetical protein
MRSHLILAAGFASLVLGAAAPPPQTPEEVWKAGIADAN